MIALLIWTVLASLSPKQAIALVAQTPQEQRAMTAICKRESRCKRIGPHQADSHLGRDAWMRAVQVGSLAPRACQAHALGEPERWSTRGAFGLIAAYSVPYLGCVPPEALDVPIVSAIAAVRRLRRAKQSGAPTRLRSWAGV